MKNHVTYETSVRLKKAGFPQPTPEAGQFWYGKKSAGQSVKGSICVLIGTPTGALSFSTIDGLKNSDNNFFVFAPTATDILKELGFPFYLIYDEAAAQWFLNNPDSETQIWKADNPAEAAAQAFLNLKAEQ